MLKTGDLEIPNESILLLNWNVTNVHFHDPALSPNNNTMAVNAPMSLRTDTA